MSNGGMENFDDQWFRDHQWDNGRDTPPSCGQLDSTPELSHSACTQQNEIKPARTEPRYEASRKSFELQVKEIINFLQANVNVTVPGLQAALQFDHRRIYEILKILEIFGLVSSSDATPKVFRWCCQVPTDTPIDIGTMESTLLSLESQLTESEIHHQIEKY